MTLLHRLILLVVLVFAPAVTLAVWEEISLREGRVVDLRTQTAHLTRLVEMEQAQYLEGFRAFLSLTAGMEAVRAGDRAACDKMLAQLDERYGVHARIHVNGADGRIRCSTEASAVGRLISGWPTVREAQENGGFTVGRYVHSDTDGTPMLPISLGFQGDETGTAQVATLLVDPLWLAGELVRIPVPEGIQIVVADRAGMVFATVPHAPGLIGAPISPSYAEMIQLGRDGIRVWDDDAEGRVVSVSPAGLAMDAFAVVTAANLTSTPSVVDAIIAPPISILAAMFLLTAGLSVWGAQIFVRRPVSILIDTTRRWRGGDLSARANLGPHADELSELGRAFDRMADDLQAKELEAAAAHAAALRMAAVLESTTDSVMEVDRDWVITVMNQQCRQLIGAGREIVGQCLWKALPDAAGGVFERECRKAMAEGLMAEFETYHDGLRIWLSVRAFPSREGLAVYMQDVTARRAAAEEQERLRRELEKERALLQAVVRNIPSGLAVAEAPSGDLILYNERAAGLLGRPLPEPGCAADAWLYGGIHPDGRAYDADEYPIIRAMRGETLDQADLLYRRPDGSKVVMAVNAAPVRDSAGRTILAVATFVDVSQRKAMIQALHEGEARLNLALSAAQAGIWDWDIGTGKIAWSKELHQLRGLQADAGEITYERWIASIHPDDQAHVAERVQRTLAEHRNDYVVEFRINHPERGLRWVASIGRASYDADGKPLRMVGLNIDITERKRMESALRAAKESSERANLAKSKFLAAASHDLRQPLQSMFLLTGALKTRVRSPDGRELLVHLERGMDALKQLLDSLLDISKLDAGLVQSEIRDFPIASLFSELDSTYGTVAKGKGIGWRVEACDAVVRSDRTLLGRMIRNLVENAVRYTEAGDVTLACRVQDGRLHVEVRDTGPGIPPDQLDAVFDEFYQLGNPERDRQQGLGLGLAIVRRLSQLLDHPVGVRSEVGKGSAFSVTIPLGRSKALSAPNERMAVTRGGGKLAVVVDDEAMILIGLKAMLTRWGYDVLIAGSGQEAIAAAAASGRLPDVVIADYRLRHGEVGTEVVQAIRAAVGAEVPGIILTGETGPESVQAVRKHGLTLIHKPVTPRQLAATLQIHDADAGILEGV